MQKLALHTFQKQVKAYYRHNGRHNMLWRQPEPNGYFDPYKILVSEIMLQQTQVSRVTPKFDEFISRFPTINILSNATLSDVLQVWSGLGYNRRAKYLHQAAKAVQNDFQGELPRHQKELITLPGIGKNTAAAVCAYAFNQPVVFIETNIRTVYIHHFFADDNGVTDAQLLELVAATLDNNSPRTWYWALMDYGTYIKKTYGNASRRSKTYASQAAFEGSVRQLRGKILRLLMEQKMTSQQLATILKDDRSEVVIAALKQEGFIVQKHNFLCLAS